MRLEKKKAIVTGAGGGIGRAVAEALAGEGAAVLCADVNEKRVNDTVAAISESGGIAKAVVGDMSKESHSEDLVLAAQSEFGGLTSVVCSHIRDVPYLPVTELPLEEWQGSLDVNLTGIFLLLKNAIPSMASSGGGSITLMASQLAFAPKPCRAWYVAQKGALISLVKALAVDHAKDKIRANTISPGPTADERFFSQWPSEEEAHANASTLFGRLGEPSEMAAGAVFLASDEASFVTGTDLLIDGGYTAV